MWWGAQMLLWGKIALGGRYHLEVEIECAEDF